MSFVLHKLTTVCICVSASSLSTDLKPSFRQDLTTPVKERESSQSSTPTPENSVRTLTFIKEDKPNVVYIVTAFSKQVNWASSSLRKDEYFSVKKRIIIVLFFFFFF